MDKSELISGDMAVLGHIALRPWSAYELVREMRRNVHYFWPRVESGLYRTLSRLEAAELVRGSAKRSGGRDRTEYRITAKGRQALKGWMAQPVAPLWMEFEGLMRIFLTPPGQGDMLLGILGDARSHAKDLMDTAIKVGGEYRAGAAPFQHMISTRALVFDFLARLALLQVEWADRCGQHIRSWEGATPKQRDAMAQALIDEGLVRLAKVK